MVSLVTDAHISLRKGVSGSLIASVLFRPPQWPRSEPLLPMQSHAHLGLAFSTTSCSRAPTHELVRVTNQPPRADQKHPKTREGEPKPYSPSHIWPVKAETDERDSQSFFVQRSEEQKGWVCRSTYQWCSLGFGLFLSERCVCVCGQNS